MPTYDYFCDKCNKMTEKFHGMNEKIEYSCGVCNSRLRRIISSGSGIIFKGEGWTPKHFK